MMESLSQSDAERLAAGRPGPAPGPIEVEVERLGEDFERPRPPHRAPWATLLHAVSPILGGMCIDLVDLATLHPMLGLPLGALAGIWVANRLGVAGPTRLWIALGSAVYCALPMTNAIPAATILGALSRLRIGAR